MSIAKKIYSRLPVPLRAAALKYAGAKMRRLRYGGIYPQYLDFLRSSESWSPEQIQKYQSEQLEKLLLEAKRYSPYYMNSLKHLSEDDLKRIARDRDLSALPILEKSDRRSKPLEFLNSSRETATVAYTSGSTGSPMLKHFDPESVQRIFAFLTRHKEWVGLGDGLRSVRLSGHIIIPSERTKPPFWILNAAEKQLIVSTYHLNGKYLDQIWEELERWQPLFIDGYPSAIIVLARYAKAKGKRLASLKGVITTAELITDEIRETLETGFGVRVFDYYSASEGLPIVDQDLDGFYYLRPESGFIEIQNADGTPTPAGEVGEIVATSFVTWRMPLIRYRSGDMAYVATDEQRKGAKRPNYTVFGGIVGRLDDMICTPDGRLMGIFSHRVFSQMNRGVAEAQIIQKTPTDFEFRLVLDKTRPVDEIKTHLEQVLLAILGYAPSVNVLTMDEIPRGPNGKFRNVIREFPVIK